MLFKIREKGYFGFINGTGEVGVVHHVLEAAEYDNWVSKVRLNSQWTRVE